MKYFILGLIFILSAVLGLFMWNGKGAWMVAGYNDLKPEEKLKYDRKQVARGASVSIFAIAVAAAVTIFGELLQKEWLYTMALVVILAGVVVTLSMGVVQSLRAGSHTEKE